MNNSREEKQERTIAVNARIDMVSLAEMLVYFNSQGIGISSMSSLVSHCVELSRGILDSNGKLESKFSAGEAFRVLTDLGMINRSTKSRNLKKIMNAIRMENLRVEGENPRNYAPLQYNMVHNSHSVEPPKINVTSDIVQKAVEEYNRQEDLEKQKMIEEARNRDKILLEHLRSQGQLVDLPDKPEERSKKVVKDWRPRKLTDEELRAKEEEIRRRDEELKEQMGVIPRDGVVKLEE
jgi:hypothetical protein